MADEQLLPAYLIVGPDEVKRDTALSHLRARLERTGMADFNMDVVDASRAVEVETLSSSLRMFPMGADFRLVVLMGCDHPSEELKSLLLDYSEDPADTTVLVVVTRQLAKSTKLYRAIANKDPKAVIDCAAKKGRDAVELARALARSHGRELAMGAAEELVSRVGESSRALDNELAKLAAMIASPTISRADVEANVARVAEVKPWDFLNAVAARDLPRALELYHLQPAKSEVRLLMLTCTRIRELICAKSLDARGRAAELASVLHLQGWQVRNHVRWARAFTFDELEDALRGAATVEVALKGSSDSVTAFTSWIATVAGRPVQGASRQATRRG